MSEMHIINKRKIFWPLLIIIVGLYLLADNLGLLPAEYLNNIWRFWPVVLIALGLSMLFK